MSSVACVPEGKDARRLRWQRAARWALLVLTGAALVLLGLKAKSLFVAAARTLGNISWLSTLALPTFCLWTLAAAAAWRPMMAASGVRRIPSLGWMWLIRLQSQALNLVLPFAGIGGEAFRAVALESRTRQGSASVASVASDVLAELAACFAFVGVGLGLGWHSIRCSSGLRLTSAIGSGAIVLALFLVPPHLARIGPWLGHGRAGRWLRSLLANMRGSSQTVDWWRSVGWHIVEKVLFAAETWIYAHALGSSLSVVGAIVATAAMTLLGCLMFFIPAQVGPADGGLVLGLQWLDVSWSTGLAVALARRMRQLVVGLVGLGIVVITTLWRQRANRAAAQSARRDRPTEPLDWGA